MTIKRRTRARFVAPILVGVGALVLSACGIGVAPKLGTIHPHGAAPPQWPHLADPAVLPAGGQYYVFGSRSANRLPISVVPTLTQSYTSGQWLAITHEGMPQHPPWAFDSDFWAPTVGLFASGYVVFFAAHYGSPNRQCIGRAFAAAPGGPYVPEAAPFSCGLDGHRGALDPAVFLAPDGRWYLYAAFADTEAPIHVIPLDANGDAPRRPDGQAQYSAFPVLGKKWPWEGRFIENPSMIYDPTTNTYLLSYSAGDWWTASYSTGLARCSTPLGACTSNPGGPWLTNGSGRTGVGGLSFFYGYDGIPKAVYSSFAAGQEGVGQNRAGTAQSAGLGWTPGLGPP